MFLDSIKLKIFLIKLNMDDIAGMRGRWFGFEFL